MVPATERKLYDLDRVDVYTVVAGSDDGFLYRRGFIVAMGREFYEAVLADPATYRGGSCEEMCYFFAHAHDDRVGDFPDLGTDISRETGANPAGRLA